MPTVEDYAKQPREQRMQRLTRTADELAAAIKSQNDVVLSRRPDAKNWSAKEVVCHLRDTEEVFGARVEQILVMDVDPKLGNADPDRMAAERQYLRNDAGEALVAFRQRRAETLESFGKLTSAQWEKGASIPSAAGSRSTTSCRSWPGTTTTTSTSSRAPCRGGRRGQQRTARP
jgi:hypothetical protein